MQRNRQEEINKKNRVKGERKNASTAEVCGHPPMAENLARHWVWVFGNVARKIITQRSTNQRVTTTGVRKI